MNKRRIKFTIKLNYPGFLLLIILLASSCAKEIAPSGGPKDELPPEVLYTEPDTNSTNFQAERIVLRFNEFFTLKNPSQNMFFNPMVDQEVKYKIKGKNLLIDVPDSLRSNTSYSLILNNAVADYHEGNLLKNFEFVFSSGTYFDSLGIQGRVIDAYTSEGKENVSLYLFPENADSVLLKKQFAYYASSVTGGHFTFKNLPEGTYQLYALFEKDMNHIYSSYEEMPGFYSESVDARAKQINDSTGSLINTLEVPILVFQEEDTVLKISKTLRARKGLQHIVFSFPIDTASAISVDSLVADSIFTTLNAERDTMSIWFLKEQKDVAGFVITANENILDTVSLSLRFTGRGVPDLTYAQPKIKPVNVFNTDRLHFYDTLRFSVSNPITEIQKENILLLRDSDTMNFQVLRDLVTPLEFMLVFENQQNTKYSVLFQKDALIDCFGGKNDSTAFSFHTTDTAFYGTLQLILSDFSEECYFFELQNIGNKKIREYHFRNKINGEKISFSGLIPGDYILKLIADQNCNRKWDTGVFYSRRPPETVYQMSGKISIMSNWVNEITWTPGN